MTYFLYFKNVSVTIFIMLMKLKKYCNTNQNARNLSLTIIMSERSEADIYWCDKARKIRDKIETFVNISFKLILWRRFHHLNWFNWFVFPLAFGLVSFPRLLIETHWREIRKTYSCLWTIQSFLVSLHKITGTKQQAYIHSWSREK